MKKGLLKKASALLSAVMLAGLVQVPASAAVTYESNYDDKTATLDLTNAGSFTSYGYEKGYKDALGGKMAGDYSIVNDVTGIPYGTAETLHGGFVLPFYAWSVGSAGTVRTLEMSMLYGGNADYMLLQASYSAHPSAWQWNNTAAFVKVENGVVYAFGKDTGIRCNKDEWLRIVVEENYNAEKSKFYINGQEIENPLTGFILGNHWTQANLGFNAGTPGTGTRDAYFAIDDVKIYDGNPFTATGEEYVSYTYTPDEDILYDEATSAVYVNEGTTIDAVLEGIASDFEYEVLTSHNNGTVITDTAAAVANGNVVIFKSEDGKSYDYLTISTDELDTTISYDPISAASSFETVAGHFNGSVNGGLYGKAQDDLAYTYTLKDESKDASIKVDDRCTYMPVIQGQNLLATNDIITTEFSVASEGNADNLNAIAYFNTTKIEDGTNGPDIYVTLASMNVKDGVVVNGKKVMDYKPNQWYRVAITWYPNLTMDVHINGVEAAKNWAYGGADKVGVYKIKSLRAPWQTAKYWFALQQGYNAGVAHEGSFSFDDTHVYTGKYKDSKKSAAGIVSEDYLVDEVKGEIYMEEGAVEVADLEDVLTITGEWTAYADATLTQEAEDVTSGTVILVKSENGKVYKYYTIKRPDERDTTIAYDPMSAQSSFEQIGGKLQGSAKAGLYGKASDDYAYTFTLKDEFKDATIKVDDRNTYVPAVFNKSLYTAEEPFTTEFSIAAEGNFYELCALANFTTARIDDGTAGDNAYIAPVSITEKGIMVNGKKVMDYTPGQWYRVAITWYPQDFAVDVYVNGVEAAKNWVFVNEEYATEYKITGLPTPWSLSKYWFALQQLYVAGAEGDPDHFGSFSFDDTHVYGGEYKNTPKNSAGIVSEDYIVDEATGEIYMEDGEVDVSELEDVLTITGDWSIYTDNTFEEEAEDVVDGAVILVKSENGMVYKYYTIKSPEVNYGQIATYVNGEDGNILEDGAVIRAEVSAYAPSFLKKSGKLVLAIYENEALKTVVATEDKAIDGDTPFGVEYTVEKAAGMSAKAMFIDSLDGLVPLTQDASFVELSE